VLLSTARLTGLVSHVPAAGRLPARAGTTLDLVRAAARAGGHFLTPDVPEPAAHTLGGVLAAGQSGPDRLRFGPARDHVLGMKVLLADGTLARTGGQLVKNVTGYDLHRLYCGSHGSLCTILEVSLRLFPEPADELYVEAEIDGRQELVGCAAALRTSVVRPLSLLVERAGPAEPGSNGSAQATGSTGGGDRWRVHLRLAGLPAVLDRERAVLESAMPGAAAGLVRAVRERRGEDARAAADEVRDRRWAHRRAPFLRVAGPPSCLSAALSELARAPAAQPVWVEPGLAVIEAGGDFTPALEALARRFEAQPAVSVQVFDGVHGPWPSLTAESPGYELMRALEQRLDPQKLFARRVAAPGPAGPAPGRAGRA
jgi:FAD/FMN-containing dehydrogenase